MLFRKLIVTVVSALIVFSGCGPKNATGNSENAAKDSTALQDSIAKASPKETYDRYWNDLARYLAGMEGQEGSALKNQELEKAAVSHRKWFDQAWETKKTRMLGEFDTFAKTELPDAYDQQRTVFYPFASFDFLHVHYLYPKAKQYVLFGLEDEGHVPDIRTLSEERRTLNLERLRIALNDILPLSFSKTNDMREELANIELSGTAPAILAFLARTGHDVLKVTHIQVNPDGTLGELPQAPKENPNDEVVTGIRIDFRQAGEAGSDVRQVFYFSQDVSDNGLKERPEFVTYLSSLKPASSFVKSASFLMHKTYFSKIRQTLMDVSDIIVQDDSGVPVRYFGSDKWKLQFYGVYTRPIELFANFYQKEMTDYYKNTEVKPLPFGIGYQYKAGTSNLLVARKK